MMTNEVEINLTRPQLKFVSSNAPNPALVAGYGAGKTTAGVVRAFVLKCKYPKQQIGYYLPTYPLVNDIVVPRFEEFLAGNNIPYKYNKNDKILSIENYGNIILRTMDKPERIIGYETSDSILDELDTLTIAKAKDVWNKVIARNRQKKPDGMPNTIGVVTTPEGYRFVYERWVKDKKDGYEIIKASTYSNLRNLPNDYIDSLLRDYPAQLVQAYIEGEFINLKNASIYPEYDRNSCNTDVIPSANEVLRIGMDFNVGNMSAVIHVMRSEGGKQIAYAVDELSGLLDTPEMITNIKLLYPGHKIIIYPDASAANRKTNSASTTDIALLREAGFQVFMNNKNPFVRDRILTMNVMFKRGQYFVNADRCPVYVDCLEKQAYDDKGEPDKTSGHDHMNDAGGYFVSYEFGMNKGRTQQFNLKGV